MMRTYIYKAIDSSDKRGYNRTIIVYRVINNKPEYLGINDEIHTAGYKGDRAVAAEIIHEKTGAKWADNGYTLLSKNIQIFEV